MCILRKRCREKCQSVWLLVQDNFISASNAMEIEEKNQRIQLKNLAKKVIFVDQHMFYPRWSRSDLLSSASEIAVRIVSPTFKIQQPLPSSAPMHPLPGAPPQPWPPLHRNLPLHPQYSALACVPPFTLQCLPS